MSAQRSVFIPADVRFPLERANGVQIVKTAAALARRGLKTTLLVRQSDPRHTEEILALYGVAHAPLLDVKRLDVRHRRGVARRPRVAFLLKALWLSTAALWRDAVVFTRDLQLADLLLGLPFVRRRVVYEAHAIEALMYQERAQLYGTAERPQPRKARRLARREARVWRRAAGFVTTTAGIRAGFTELFGARERTRVIPNGCDVACDRTFPPLTSERRVVYAGQLYPWKGVDVLVEAFAQLPDARLVILGGIDGEADHERVRRLVEARGLARRVEMLGTVPHNRVAEEMRAGAVIAVPFLKSVMTERHTSPIKAFEAMAAGRPIVCTDLPSSREILSDGVTALLVPPGDAAALASAIRLLLDDRQLAERLARAAFEESLRYSWDARAERLHDLFAEVP